MPQDSAAPDPHEIKVPACEDCGGRVKDHPQTHLRVGNESACVDEDMVAVLRVLWAAGARTLYSCQDEDGRAQVTFPNAASLELGLNLLRDAVVRACDGRMLQRLEMAPVAAVQNGSGWTEVHQPEHTLWAVRIWPQLWWRAGVAPDADHLSSLNYQLTWPITDHPNLCGYLASS